MKFSLRPRDRAPELAQLQKASVRLAVPYIAGNLMASAVFFIDALMLSRVGRAELAAASMAGVLLWRLTETTGCIQVGTAAIVSRRWGAEQFRAAREAASHGILLAGALGLLLGGPLIALLPAILKLLGAEPDVLRAGAAYAGAILCVFPLTQMSINLGASMRAAGDTRTPLLASILANLINVLGNYILIFGHWGAPRLGMLGAGIASALGFASGFAFLALAAMRGVRPKRLFTEPVYSKDPVTEPELDLLPAPVLHIEGKGKEARAEAGDPRDNPEFRLVRGGARPWLRGVTPKLLGVSAPSLLEEILVSIGFLLFIRLIAEFGTTALAAHASVVRIESLSFMIGAGFAVSASTLVGQSLGRRDSRTALLAFKLCAWLAIVLMGMLGILLSTFPQWLLGWFSHEADFLALAVPLLLIAALEQPMIGLGSTLSGGLRGAGDTISPTLAQLGGNIVVRVGLGYTLGFLAGLGVAGIYWATLIDWSLRSVILLARLAGGHWKRRQI